MINLFSKFTKYSFTSDRTCSGYTSTGLNLKSSKLSFNVYLIFEWKKKLSFMMYSELF